MNTFSILDYGAIPGAQGLQTEAIQKAIDACFLAGGGEVTIPAGDYRTGGLRLRSNMTLHLLADAHLFGSRDPEDYMAFLSDQLEPVEPIEENRLTWIPPSMRDQDFDYTFIKKALSRWNNALIRLIDAHDVAIIGEEGAFIDGCDPYDAQGEENYRGPHGVNAQRCRNLTFSRYVIRNTGNWAHALFDCENIVMKNVTVLAGHDGIHMTGCDNALIEDCAFYTGDDCIAGIDNVNVTALRCVLNTACSGLRFGGTNALFEDCRFFGPAKYLFRGSLSPEEKQAGKAVEGAGNHRYNMLSILTYYADFSHVIRHAPGNIVIKNCTAENCDRFLHYNFSGNETWQRNRPLTSVTFDHVAATNVRLPLAAYGSEAEPLTLVMKDVDVAFAEDSAVPFMHLAFWKDVTLERVRVRGVSGPIFIKTWSDGPAPRVYDCDFVNFAGTFLKRVKEPFRCTPI